MRAFPLKPSSACWFDLFRLGSVVDVPLSKLWLQTTGRWSQHHWNGFLCRLQGIPVRRPYHHHVLTMAAMAHTTQMCCVFRWCGQRWWRNNLPCLGRPPERFPIYGGTPKFPVIIHLQMGFSIIIHPFGSTPIYGTPHIFSKKHEQIQLISNEQVYNLYNWLGTALRGTWWF